MRPNRAKGGMHSVVKQPRHYGVIGQHCCDVIYEDFGIARGLL